MPKDVIEFAVEFIYSDENIGRLAWEAKKRTPNRKEKWKELKNVFAMRSLVLKNDIATMYAGYIAKHEDAMPGKPPIGRSIAKHITGGGKQQEAHTGVDYIKVNFHIDNFSIVDKLIDILAPLSDVDHTLRNELRGLHTDVYTFLSYGYALHAREGVRASEDTEDQCDYSHQPQEHEVQQLRAYQELEELVSQPDKLDDPGIQEAIVSMIRGQLSCCAQFKGSVVENSNSATTHSPVFSLDLTSHRKPNKNPKAGGHLECNACRSPFLFFDKLRCVALMKLDRSPTKLSELADVLLTIHQCERRSYRYMAHVMQAAQQAHRMKLAIAEMDSSTAYIVYDFKQKFLAKEFREGGDSYYGKKGMMWWGAGVFIKPETRAVISSPLSCTDKLYVEIDFSSEEARLRNEMEAMNIDNLDEGNSYLLGELDEHELRGEGSEHEVEDDGSEHEVEDEGSEHEVEDEGSEHEVHDDGSEHEVEDEGSEHEVEDEGSEHEVEDDGSEHEVEDDGSEHEVEDDGSEHDNSGSNDDLSVHEKDQPTLHFIDCIVQGEQKCDANVVLSCFEAAFHVLRSRFPHVKKIIIQSDNAKNLAGKQSKLLLPHVCSAAGFKLVAYYHNEAQSGKDVCDTHFSHQQTQVGAYLTQGEGGRKISTPKQLAVALMEKSTINTTVLLIKPNFKAPYRSAVCPSIKGISEFYVAQYITNNTSNQQNILLYNCLGQTIPFARVHLPSCHASSLITPMGEDGINFTGVTVLLNSDNDDACTKVRMEKKRYTKRTKCTSKRELQKMEQQREHEEALRQIKALYPQCSECHYHFKSQKLLDKHICDGAQQCLDALSIAMRHADKLLAQMNLTVHGAIQKASLIGTGDEMPFTTFEPNFYSGWAYTRKNMHPLLTTKVKTIINECWKAGENKDLGNVKISADGVFARLEEMETQKVIKLSELPLPGKIRVVYQTIGRMTQVPTSSTSKRKRERPQSEGSIGTKKARVSFEELDLAKDLLSWKKPELEAYLSHYNIKKSSNKPELIKRVEEHMFTV